MGAPWRPGGGGRLLREGGRSCPADVTDTGTVLSQLAGEQFDVVFTSHGTIVWLSDLRPWARTIAGALKPGGTFFIADSHPFTWMFDETSTEPALRFRYEYFTRDAFREEVKGSYAVPDADFQHDSYCWQHDFGEIVSSLAEAGLTIVSLRECPYLFWKWFPWMVEDGQGIFRLPEGMPDIPLMFSLQATKTTPQR